MLDWLKLRNLSVCELEMLCVGLIPVEQAYRCFIRNNQPVDWEFQKQLSYGRRKLIQDTLLRLKFRGLVIYEGKKLWGLYEYKPSKNPISTRKVSVLDQGKGVDKAQKKSRRA